MDFEQLEASAGIGASFGIPEMLSAAEAQVYYAWQHNCAWEDLVAVPFPALAELREGRFLVLGRDDFVARWSGRLVLLTTHGIASRRP